MAAYSRVVPVPEPDPGSYNPGRPPGKLLQAQVLHVRETLLQHLQDLAAVLAIDPKSLKSEAEVSAYVGRATAILHTHWPRSARK
jgi:hypothetical protein